MNNTIKTILEKRIKFCRERLKECQQFDNELVERLKETREDSKKWNKEIDDIYKEFPELIPKNEIKSEDV